MLAELIFFLAVAFFVPLIARKRRFFFVQIWQHSNSRFMDLAALSGSNIRRKCDVRFFPLQHLRQDIVPARQCCLLYTSPSPRDS